MREMRAINFVNRWSIAALTEGGQLKKMLIHCIDAEDEMSNLGVSSKLNVGREFLIWLFELGRERADVFLCVSISTRSARTRRPRSSSVSCDRLHLTVSSWLRGASTPA